MKKNGFVSTALIYTFFIIFLVLMLFLLNSYSKMGNVLNKIRLDVQNDLINKVKQDLNLVIKIQDIDDLDNYIEVDEIPGFDYEFENDKSSCKDRNNNPTGSIAITNDGFIEITGNEVMTCEAYFKIIDSDIILRIYKDNKIVDDIPQGYEFDALKSKCSPDGKVIYNNGQLIVKANKKAICEAYFKQSEN